jgi:intracellular sulfur oxidation DsrE/DsrF family protein
MNKLKRILILTSIVLSTSQVLSAQSNPKWETPLIKGYGPIKYFKNADMQPKKNIEYKVVVKMTGDAMRKGINRKLFLISRLVNMLHAGGVSEKNIHIVGVIFGKATSIVLNNEAYQKRFHKNNPNLDVIKKLTQHGVKLNVCDQALAEHKIQKNEVNKNIQPVLAGNIAILTYQQENYLLIQ